MRKKLLLHSCCAPCLTAVYERLSALYDIVVYWYNPNIWPQKEHLKRLEVLKKYCSKIDARIIIESYDYFREHDIWKKYIAGLEDEPEKGLRCKKCYSARLEKTAQAAKINQFDLFASELSVSPHKNAAWLNEAGQILEQHLGIKYLISDFKKQNGFARSVELSKQCNLYRQNYCGCEYSQ